jgi:hypothetical protein
MFYRFFFDIIASDQFFSQYEEGRERKIDLVTRVIVMTCIYRYLVCTCIYYFASFISTCRQKHLEIDHHMWQKIQTSKNNGMVCIWFCFFLRIDIVYILWDMAGVYDDNMRFGWQQLLSNHLILIIWPLNVNINAMRVHRTQDCIYNPSYRGDVIAISITLHLTH